MRIRRSELTTPGSNLEMMSKAANSDADEVILDLEDAVASSEKENARQTVIEAVNEFNWEEIILSYRINDVRSKHSYEDIIHVIESVGEEIDTIVIPKVIQAEDVKFVDRLLSQIEQKIGISNPIGIEVLIEETQAVQNVNAIASSSPRLESLIFGPADYSASQGVNVEKIGNSKNDENYPGDIWHYVRNSIVIAARSNGLDAIDGPYGDFSDIEGYETECRRSKSLGFVGKWAIHPRQIKVANEVYGPTKNEIDRARNVIKAMESSENMGAVEMNGEMLDEASVRKAENILEQARKTGAIED